MKGARGSCGYRSSRHGGIQQPVIVYAQALVALRASDVRRCLFFGFRLLALLFNITDSTEKDAGRPIGHSDLSGGPKSGPDRLLSAEQRSNVFEGLDLDDPEQVAEARARYEKARDPQRDSVYAAEESAGKTLRRLGREGRRFQSVEAAQAFVGYVTTSAWFRDRTDPDWDARPVKVFILPVLTLDWAATTKLTFIGWTIGIHRFVLRREGEDDIVLAVAIEEETLLHEIAHILAQTGPRADRWMESHGSAFTRAHLELIREFRGEDEARIFANDRAHLKLPSSAH